jgi:toxin ParE1/3/4
MGRLRPELRDDVRRFSVQRYLIFYRVLNDDDVVEIVHVFHGARDMEDLF